MTPPSARPGPSRAFLVTCIALATGCAAYAAALAWLPAAHFNGHYSPVGVDSFYHARRILDAVANPSGFYEFDPRMHVPEGSWITWPWAYDELLAWIVRAVQHVTGARDAMAILAFIPPTWAFANAALFIAVGATLGLTPGWLAFAGAAFALSSLTQMLHAVGVIDHHYVEYTFVLASLLGGLRWLRAPARALPAAATGVVLGIAPAFHNGLFALQIPVDLALLALWLHGQSPPRRSVAFFAGALVLGTLAAVVPSDPFRDAQFSMTTLSWFHLYVAGASAAGAVFLSARAPSRANLALLLALGAAALVPAAHEIATGSQFLGASLVKLDEIAEALSLWRQLNVFGMHGVLVTYSGWIVLLPVALAACVAGSVRRSTPPMWRFAAVSGAFGLVLMYFQARLHYFGSPTLYLFPVLALQHARPVWPGRAALAARSLAVAGLVAGYVPVWSELWVSPPPAWDFSGTYDVLDRTIYPRLRAACAEHPGVVLAGNDDGHYIRYNSECSVISNNFILTPQHERKLLETQRLLSLPAAEVASAAPDVDYVLVRGSPRDDGLRGELLSGDGPFPPGFTLLGQVRTADGAAAARLFRIDRTGAAGTGH